MTTLPACLYPGATKSNNLSFRQLAGRHFSEQEQNNPLLGGIK